MTRACPRGSELAQAIAQGTMTPELLSHAGGCEACVTTWLTSAVRGTSMTPATIDPAALWERAGRMRRLRAEAQISRIVTGAQVTAAVLILAVLVYFGSQPATWSSLSFARVSGIQLAVALGMLVVAVVGVSLLYLSDRAST